MKIISLILLLLGCLYGIAQKQSFDIVNYSAPAGWKKETQATLVAYNKIDKVKKTWGQIAVLKSVVSNGDIEKDFQKEWDDLVVKQYSATGLQTTEVHEADGWKIKAGTGQFRHNNADAIVMLTTMSGYNTCVSVLSTTNSQAYLRIVQDFLESVELSKPVATTSTGNTQQSSNPGNYAYSTTNFNDGWTSVIQDDWVLVSKEDIKVYLWYALPYNASDFTGTGLVDRDYYWDNYVSKYFNIESKQYKDNGEVMSSLKPAYVEGWATNKQTGERRFIGMRLDISPNTAYITIGTAKDEASLWKQFPKANGGAFSPSDLSNMGGYNKFAITANDILGTWQDGNTSTAQWYYIAPSGYEGYAGMTVAARSASFTFNPGDDYSSIHNGATGAVGAMNTFQQNYKGKYTVTNWTLTATNRFKGKTDSFEAWFVVVRGGRILKLKDGGMEYNLMKSK